MGQSGLLLLVASEKPPTLSWRHAPDPPDTTGDTRPAEQGTLRFRSTPRFPTCTSPGKRWVRAASRHPPSYGVYLLPASAERSKLHPAELAGFDPLVAARLVESAAPALDQRQPLPAAESGEALAFIDPLLLTRTAYSHFSKGRRKQGFETLRTLDQRFPWMPDRAALHRLAQPAIQLAEKPQPMPLFWQGFLALQDAEPGPAESALLDRLVWAGAFTRFRA